MRSLYGEKEENREEKNYNNLMRSDGFVFSRDMEERIRTTTREIENRGFEAKTDQYKEKMPESEKRKTFEPDFDGKSLNEFLKEQETNHIDNERSHQPEKKEVDYAAMGPDVRRILEYSASLDREERQNMNDYTM